MAGTLEVSLSVRNESSRAGEATVFLFVRDPLASVSRALLELKAVSRIGLEPGETARIEWQLPVAALAFIGVDFDRALEPGRFELYAGESADPAGLLRCDIEVMGSERSASS
jgi:beta-glucosidase